MKKLVLTSIAALAGATLVHAQGTISLQEAQAGTVITNGTAIGGGTGNAASGYDYEILDMTSASWAGLSGNQQTGADSLLANPSDVSLWTDSGVSGAAASLTKGGIVGLGTGAGTSAANWAAPTSSNTPGGDPTAYYTAAGYDYYVVVGWSTSLGTTWSAVSSALASATSGYFGMSSVFYNYGGGSGLSAPNVFSPAATTQLPGSGTGTTGQVNPEITLMAITVVPEPTTLALAGLGGISMLFLRRRKS